jgi:pimeloyl-ACP methyl ester carboxylesterase
MMTMPGSFLTLPSGTLYVHDFDGGGINGDQVVAIHGLGGNHLNWMAVAPGLSRWGQVSAPDLPGFGYSPPRKSFAVTAHAAAIAELLERNSRPALLIGNSLGGLVAITIAATRPELVGGMVLISPASPPRLRDPRIDRQVARRLLLQGAPVIGPAVVRSYWKRSTPRQQALDTLAVVCHRPHRVEGEMLERSLRLAAVRRTQPWAVTALVRSGRAAGVLLANRPRLARLVRAVQAPTLLIQGSHDRVIAGSGVEWMADLRPDWTRVLMEAGHCPQFDSPEECVEVISSWLGDRPAADPIAPAI